MKIFGLIVTYFLLGECAQSQKPPQVIKIDEIVFEMNKMLPLLKSKTIDTIEYFKEEETRLPDSCNRHIVFHYNSSNDICQITEKVKYHNWTTIVTVYYSEMKTLKYQRVDKYLDEIKNEFDLYYFNDEFLYLDNRIGIGIPDHDIFLKFSYQLLNK